MNLHAQGKEAFVNAWTQKLLDDLHEHIQNEHIQKGSTTGEFLKLRETELTQPNQSDVATTPEQISLFQPAALVAVVETIVKRLVPSSGSRLSYLRELEGVLDAHR